MNNWIMREYAPAGSMRRGEGQPLDNWLRENTHRLEVHGAGRVSPWRTTGYARTRTSIYWKHTTQGQTVADSGTHKYTHQRRLRRKDHIMEVNRCRCTTLQLDSFHTHHELLREKITNEVFCLSRRCSISSLPAVGVVHRIWSALGACDLEPSLAVSTFSSL